VKTQLWIDHEGYGEPCAERYTPVRGEKPGWAKPAARCAFWTSTHGDEDSWLAWLIGEVWSPGAGRLEDHGFWLLEPDPAARVYEIDALDDLVTLLRDYGLPKYPTLPDAGLLSEDKRILADDKRPDFEAMARDGFDGLHLTGEGQWLTRLSLPSLYGWDCESTLWFRWAFTVARRTTHEEAIAALPAEARERAAV